MLNNPAIKEMQIKTMLSSTSPVLEWLPAKTQTIINVGEDIGKKELLYTIGGNVNLYKYYGKQYGGYSKN
jgi:hypothetical protein